MSEKNRLERIIGDFGRGLTGYGRSVLPLVGSTILAAASIVMAVEPVVAWFLFGIGVVFVGLGVLAMFLLRPGYWALRRNHDDLEAKFLETSAESRKREGLLNEDIRAFKTSIVAILNHVARRALEVAAPGTDLDRCRISIYVEREAQFVLVARWSRSERLRQLGRKQFPMGEGLIGEAWDSPEGVAHVDGLKGSLDEWIQAQQIRYEFDEATLKKLTMRPRSMSAVCVGGEKKTPIIVVESLEAKLLGLRATRDLKQSDPYLEMARIISDPDIIIPQVHETLPASGRLQEAEQE